MDHDKFDQWDEDRRRRREAREARRASRGGRREAAPERPDERQRKERVLHTRISDQLDDTLRRAADDLRLPVSNLVRNVLEDVFKVVESVTENVEELVEDIVDEAQDVGRRLRRRGSQWERDVTPHRSRRDENEPARRAAKREMDELLDEAPDDPSVDRERQEFPDVVGWQPLVLNQPQKCADCGRDLIRGDRGYLGTMLPPPADGVPYLCSECMRTRS